MDYAQIITMIINFTLLCLIFYAFVFVIPEDKAMYEQCKEELLCENGVLKGSVCDKYEKGFSIVPNFTNTTGN